MHKLLTNNRLPSSRQIHKQSCYIAVHFIKFEWYDFRRFLISSVRKHYIIISSYLVNTILWSKKFIHMPVISVGQVQITTRTIFHWKHSMSEAIYHPWDPDCEWPFKIPPCRRFVKPFRLWKLELLLKFVPKVRFKYFLYSWYILNNKIFCRKCTLKLFRCCLECKIRILLI